MPLSISITCHGCGQRLRLPDDFARRKVRCSACGVYCEVVEPVKKPRAAAPAEKQASKNESPPAGKKAAKATPLPSGKQPARIPSPPAKAEAIFEESYRQMTAPLPAPQSTTPTDPLPKTPSELAKGKAGSEKPDNDAMYGLVAADSKKCPDCHKDLPLDVKLCMHCGFNLETGKRPVKVYEEVNKTWEAGWPFARRRNFYVICMGIIPAAALTGAASTGQWAAFLFPCFYFAMLFTFILGTYDRLDFTRD